MNTTPETLANIQVPSEDLHTRFFANGLTKYDYATIITTLQEMDNIKREVDALADQASAIVCPYDKFPGNVYYAPESVQRINELTASDLWDDTFATGDIGHGGREKWPVNKWQKQMASLRRMNSKLRKAIEVHLAEAAR